MKSTLSRIGQFKPSGKPLQIFILGLCIAGAGALTLALPKSSKLTDLGTTVNLNSAEGEQLLVESKARQDYLPLSIYFVTQDKLTYCGVASSTMILNALGVPAPTASEYGSARIFTQRNFFNEKTQKIVKPEVVSRQGMTVAQLGQLLESHSVKAEVRHAADSSLEEFRSLVVKNLQEPGNFVLINYYRNAIGQQQGGHISPVAAYNDKTDRFLILDVSRYKYPPVWVSAADLWKSMATTDSSSGKTRGFVLVSRK